MSKARYISRHVHFQSLINNDIHCSCSYVIVLRNLSLQSTGTEKRFNSYPQLTYRPEPHQPHVRRYLIQGLSSVLSLCFLYLAACKARCSWNANSCKVYGGMQILTALLCRCGPRYPGRYSDSLPARGCGDQIAVDNEIFRTCPDRPWDPPGPL